MMIKVLFLAANPADTERVALDEEIRTIDAMIRGAEYRDRLDLISHWAVRLGDLSGLLMRRRPDIVHFSGHGSSSGAIVLARSGAIPSGDPSASPGEAGEAGDLVAEQNQEVPPEALAAMFRAVKANVRVVIFNACYSEGLARAVVKEVDCAIGTSRTIDDEHAIAFAAEFYQALGFGKSVEDAYELGAARLIGEGVHDARRLVKLHRRRGVDPAAIVLVEAQQEAPLVGVPANLEATGGAGRPDGARSGSATDGSSSPIRTENRQALSTLRLFSESPEAAIALESHDRIVTIGRSPASMVRLDHPEVSWEHGQIILRNGEYAYIHLSRTNSTLVRRRREQTLLAEDTIKEFVLRNQDRLTIGSVTFVVEFDLITETSGYVETAPAEHGTDD